jgi:hypothetical protein
LSLPYNVSKSDLQMLAKKKKASNKGEKINLAKIFMVLLGVE